MNSSDQIKWQKNVESLLGDDQQLKTDLGIVDKSNCAAVFQSFEL